VHGREDRRVDFEHTRRLLRMLDFTGRTPVGLVFDKAGHGFDDPADLEALWGGVAGFLRQHLDGDAGDRADDGAAKPQAAATANAAAQ